MRSLKILLACEESQTVCKEFRELGHEAYSCDILPSSGGRPDWHFQQDVLQIIKGGVFSTEDNTRVSIDKWDVLIGFPDCTYLTVTANKWLKDQPPRKSGALVGEERRKARERGISFFLTLAQCDIPVIAIENPVGCMSSVWRKPDQIVQPFQFGHKEPKKTCLWLKGLPNLKPTDIVEPEYHTTKSGKRMPLWYAYADKTQGQKHRAGIRSKTFSGIAKAMATQWSDYILNPDKHRLGLF